MDIKSNRTEKVIKNEHSSCVIYNCMMSFTSSFLLNNILYFLYNNLTI